MNILEKIDYNAPMKWKKHLILPLFGLRTFEDLESEIHRYDIKDAGRLVADISDDIQTSSEREEKNLYIISLISKSKFIKLPNIQIKDLEELSRLDDTLSSMKTQYDEMWFTKKSLTRETSSLVGRISFQNGEYRDRQKRTQGNEQCVEQVWNSSHRAIEGFTGSPNNIYLRASREGWMQPYSIERLHIPKGIKVDKEQVVSQFFEAVKRIELSREKTEIFAEHLKKLGINEFGLEYMLANGKFLFIDWDTNNDEKVIKSMINKDKESDIEIT